MPYLLQESAIRGIWSVAVLHLRVTPYALDRFNHAHLALLNSFDQKMAGLRPKKEFSGLST